MLERASGGEGSSLLGRPGAGSVPRLGGTFASEDLGRVLRSFPSV